MASSSQRTSPVVPARGLSNAPLIIGDNVSETMAETVTAPTSVKANSVNNAPVSPP